MGRGGARPGSGPKPKPKPVEPLPPPVTGPRWFVFMAHANAERSAAVELGRQGYRVYLPLTAIRRPDRLAPGVIHKVLVVRFPGYGFVELAPGDAWVPVCNTAGVAGMIRGGHGRPVPVPIGEVEWHQKQDAKECDLTTLSSDRPAPVLKVGSVVRVLDGPFTSFYGAVVADDGLATAVRLSMFGRLMTVQFRREQVEPV